MMSRACLAALLLIALSLTRPATAQGYEVQADGRRQNYGFLERAAEPWRICALLPHGKDRYWWGVSWGLAQQARQLGVQLGIYQANSYADLPLQKKQWADCRALGAQAYILAAISADGLSDEIAQAMAEKKAVIDLINGVSAEVSSRAVVSFADMAAQTIAYLLRDASGRSVKLAWFPGPADAAWVQDGERGLMDALSGRPVELRLGGRGAPDAKTQSTLVREHLDRAGMPDYIVGNAVAIEFAARLVAQRPGTRPKLLAYYATEDVVERIASGEVLAAPTDQPILQARIALDLAVRALQGQRVPKRVSPSILMLDRQSLKSVDLTRLLPPKGQWLVQQPLPAGSAVGAAATR
ncbi:UNVERIFIED_ORG: TMAO reductase system periplasmic protein TorT [Shinella sp. XGS7]|nr:TMAO reductase system periplasmic protein TorT [Shinella sp. XGS7]